MNKRLIFACSIVLLMCLAALGSIFNKYNMIDRYKDNDNDYLKYNPHIGIGYTLAALASGVMLVKLSYDPKWLEKPQ